MNSTVSAALVDALNIARKEQEILTAQIAKLEAAIGLAQGRGNVRSSFAKKRYEISQEQREASRERLKKRWAARKKSGEFGRLGSKETK